MGEKAEPTGIKYPPSEFSQKYSRSNCVLFTVCFKRFVNVHEIREDKEKWINNVF